MSSSHEWSDTYSNVLQAWSKSPSRHLCIDGYIDVGQESSRKMKKKVEAHCIALIIKRVHGCL